MNNRCRLFITIAALIMCASCGRDGPLLVDVALEKISRNLDTLAPSLMQKHAVAGMSIGLIRDNKLVLTKHFGFADRKTHKKINDYTIFRAASLGKPLFAYIVLALSQKGIIDLDTPLQRYTEQAIVKDDPRSKRITARMVLSHTTGLPNFGDATQPKFQFDPGTQFHYSGYAYQFLQDVIEKITGKGLQQLAKEWVFTPLEMNHSSYIWQKHYKNRLSNSYYDANKQRATSVKVFEPHAAWSLYTSLEDYAKFVIHILKLANQRDTLAHFSIDPQVQVAPGVKWGLGWGLQSTDPNASFWHWGSIDGFRHYTVAYPVESTAVLVFTNSENAFKMVDKIMAASIGGSFPSYDWF